MQPQTIYLLDDEPAMLELLTEVVERHQIPVKPYQQAKQLFLDAPIFSADDLLVLDLNMPEMDGVEVMRQLAELASTPSLLLISGHDESVLHSAEKLGKAHNLHIVDCLIKPISMLDFDCILKQYTKVCPKVEKQQTQANEFFSLTELQNAIRREQMVLHYQPQFELATGKVIGCEGLVRWFHPSLGVIYPDQFIPLVEQQGWMESLTNLVIEQALRQEQTWQAQGIVLPISINISADNITSLWLPEYISDLLEHNELTPELLTLEITESALMGELVTSLDILTRLRLKGLRLSIDDFGTGYSSLSQLHKIPFTELKIDRSFVNSMLKDKDAQAIVKTCIMLGHELNMKVVAEGVETKEHVEILTSLGCDIAQGYFYSKPITAQELTEKLENSWK